MSADLAGARRRLEDERVRVERRIAARAADLGEAGDLGDDEGSEEHERADVARDIVAVEQQRQLLEGLQAELREIEAALQRVADGTYGIDEETGEPIDPARLEALPTARTNVESRSPASRSPASRPSARPSARSSR